MLERVLWRLVLVLIIMGAVLSVWAVMGGTLTPTAAKVLVSSYGVAIYAAMGLGCAAVSKRQPTSLGARAGLVIAFAGAFILIAGIWLEVARFNWWWKLFGSSFVLSFAAVHASLLLLVPLETRFTPFRAITRACSYGCAGLLVFMMFFERGDDLLFRIVGLTSTIATFGTLSMPVLWKLGRSP